MGSIFLILLLAFQSFQTVIKEDLTLHIKETFEASISKLERITTLEEATPILDDLKIGERGQVLVLDIGQELPTEDFSEETQVPFLKERSGIIDDFKKDLKLIAFFEAPLLHKKIASIIYLSDFYKSFNVFGRFFIAAVFFVLVLTVGIIAFMVIVLTHSVYLLSTAVKEAETSGKPFAPDIHTDDEFEELSHAFSHYIRKSEQVQEELEAKVKERTKELEGAKKQLETVNLDLELNVKKRTAELEKLKTSLEETVAERTQELNQKLSELERINTIMVDRELKMVEMKKELEELKKKSTS